MFGGVKRKVVRVGSRGSVLALRQTEEVIGRLSRFYPEVQWEVVPIKTAGDRLAEDPETAFARGMFVKEVEEALLEGRVDIAVHSFKDLPTELPPGLTIFAVPEREDPRDVLVSRSRKELFTLPAGSTVGTSSVRRKVQLEYLRPDLRVVPLRGNVSTRLRKMEEGQVEALVLAAAGLKRLEKEHYIVEHFSPEVVVPAVGQGALAVEGRVDDPLQEMVRAIHHAATAWAVEAERDFLRFFGGGCRIPVGALATVRDNRITLIGMVAQHGVVKKAFIEGPIEERERMAWFLARELGGGKDG